NGRNYRRLQKLRKASYEMSLQSELSAPRRAMLRETPTLIFPLRSTSGMKLFSNCDRKTAAAHSCSGSLRKFNNLDDEVSSAFKGTWQFITRFAATSLLFAWCGCAAHLATVKTQPARLPTGLHVEGPLDPATKYLVAAEHEQPLAALGHDLLAARISYDVLERHPKNESARRIYNFAVARVVHDVDRTDVKPWRHPITVSTDQGRYTLVSPKPLDAEHDPSRYDLIPADTLTVGGTFLKSRSTVAGVGAPLVAVG